jgi:murein DD-endopeptidase MepM/ murein hydrolase activator NlpD
MKARAMHPGEVVRFDISHPLPIAQLQLHAFDKPIAAYQRPDGRWSALLGIDLDVAAGPHPVTVDATLAAGAIVSHVEVLAVQPKAFRTRTLRVAPRFVNPPEPVQQRIERERLRLAGIFGALRPEPQWSRPFVRPIRVGVISGFGVRSVYNGEPRASHGGADFASPAGTPVRAPAGGTMVLAESLYFTGDTVVIDHGVGLVSLFAHLSRIDVAVGSQVDTGERLGLVGATGRVTGPHLHWTVRLQGARVDPLSVIAALAAARR